ncbi:MAG: beta-ketoacyl-ACP synthase II [Candidatus Cloacimonetes bacterium]|nr:beta-ketoacyl-ACP synthase II [Candidatus Cloacimonadota bacterium]
MERVVITGIGSVSALGHDSNTMFQNLLSGVSGVGPISHFDTEGHDTKIAAEVKDLPVEKYFDVKSLKKFDRFSQFAWIAAEEAMKQSGLQLEQLDLHRAGVLIGSGIGGIMTLEATMEQYRLRGTKGVSPFFISNLISNEAGGNVAIRYGFKGMNFGIVSACSTGTHCIGESFKAIRYKEQDIMIAGGTEASITPLTVAGFSNMKAMSRNNQNPKNASRPFDRDRDGFVIGEGSGVLVMESLTHAKKRGANILAEVIGYGATCDAHHITAIAPGGEGMARAIQLALSQAGTGLDSVDYINAHGTSTPIGDKYETECIKSVFKEHAYRLSVSSTKSMIGHLLGAAGGVESVVCVKSLLEQCVHPTMNLDNPDEGCDLDYVAKEARQKKVTVVLKNSMGFGGHNAALLFRAFS